MPRCIAFLRAVNVCGRFIKMARLQAEFQALRLADVQTFIASGNVVFDTRARDMAALAARIETHLHRAFGFEVHTFLRTPAEVAAIARCAPFDAAATAGTFRAMTTVRALVQAHAGPPAGG